MTGPYGNTSIENSTPEWRRFRDEAWQKFQPRDSRGHVTILLPALNEERAIGGVLAQLPRNELEIAGYRVSVLIVDGNSTDRTLEVGREGGARIFVQDGKGKGNGVIQAFHYLLHPHRDTDGGSPEAQYLIMLDADGTYPADAIPNFVAALEDGNDIVLGSRLLGHIEDGAMTQLNLLGNRALSALATLLYGEDVSDLCTGMWGFTADFLRRVTLSASGFDLEADLFASACLANARITEIPIDYAPRIGPPKLIPLRTGVQIARRLVMQRLSGVSHPHAVVSKEVERRRGTTA